MRKPERLDAFYTELMNIHKENYTDLRFGQFIAFINNYITKQGLDPFFLEEKEYLDLVKEVVSVYKRS